MESHLSTKPFAMRNFILSFVSLLFAGQLLAQSFAGFSNFSILLKSDTNTKSVLMSDLLENRVGDLSPIIGSSSWVDKGKRFQCRSLLSFQYGFLPTMIDAEMISNAQLVLIPLQIKDQATENESDVLNLTVRRVVQHWQDSTTSWINQPKANTGDEVIKRISAKKRFQPIKINVTEIVKNMFRYGNHGFLICYGDSLQGTKNSSHWFASARYEDENVRPVLYITYSKPVQHLRNQFTQNNPPPIPLTAQDRNELMQMYIRPEPVTPTVQAEPVPVKPKENN
jgi:hypothetical protein